MAPVTLSRTEFFELIWTMPVSKILEQFPVSRQFIQTACKDMAIPVPPNGHWSKLKFNKAEARPELPDDYSGPMEITMAEPEPEISAQVSDSLIDLGEYENILTDLRQMPGLSMKVPDRLTDPDPMIVAAQRTLQNKKLREDECLVSTGQGELDIVVTPANVNRALRFMNTLVKCAKRRGFRFDLSGKYTHMEKERVDFRIICREKTKKVPNTADYPKYLPEPTGELYFFMGTFGGGTWKDGRELLEDQIPDILVKMELRVSYLHRVWEEKKQDEEKRALGLEKEKELARVAEIEENCGRVSPAGQIMSEKPLIPVREKALIRAARQWKKAQLIRQFVADMVLKGGEFPDVDGKKWQEWALGVADNLMRIED